MRSEEIKKILVQQFTNQVGYAPNLNNPKSFNEKIQWYKLYYRDPLMSQCADKLAVRGYVSNKIGDEYLNTLIGSYESEKQINFSSLPNKFALKLWLRKKFILQKQTRAQPIRNSKKLARMAGPKI